MCIHGQRSRTFLPHVHVVNFSVPVLGLADATVGKGVAGMIRIHAKVEVVTWMSHGQLENRMRRLANRNNLTIETLLGNSPRSTTINCCLTNLCSYLV